LSGVDVTVKTENNSEEEEKGALQAGNMYVYQIEQLC